MPLISCGFGAELSEDPQLLESIVVTFEGVQDTFFVYQSFSNALTNESIQLRKEKNEKNASFVFERYDAYLGNTLTDDQLLLFLKDDNSYLGEVDTLSVDLRRLIED